jgi:RNA polymerase sigma factor (sigma-70 family)
MITEGPREGSRAASDSAREAVGTPDSSGPHTAGPPIPAADADGRQPVWVLAGTEFAAWRGGEPAGLDRLVRLLTPVLWQVVRACGLDRDATEDVIQTTWLALVRSAPTIGKPESVMRWLTVSARREAWRIAREDNRTRYVEPDEFEAALPAVTAPEHVLFAEASARVLWRHVKRLSQRCQRLLRAAAFDTRPDYASLATELGIPVGGIGPTRRRCLDKLRQQLAVDQEWPGHE